MDTDRLVGKILDGRYKILEPLGAGGMGTVYKAKEIALERFIALKLLKNSDMSEEDQARFEREGKIVSELVHQNIVNFYRFGFAPDGTPYIAMEHLQGKTLRDLLNSESQLNWHRIGKIVVQICHALEYTHGRAIVHRDLKPENIMLVDASGPETVKLLDFGLATFMPAAVESYQRITTTGQLVGSVNYISPEQCVGKIVDHRADIYALGCIMYEAVSGRLPHVADNPLGVVYKHANDQPDKFGQFLQFHSIPLAFEKIVFHALEKDPAKRYSSATELRQELEQLMQDPAATLTLALAGLFKEGSPEQQKKSKIQPLVICAALAICLLVFSVAFLHRSNLAERAAQESLDFQPRTELDTRIRGFQVKLQVARKNLARMKKQFAAMPAHSADRIPLERELILELLNACSLSYHVSDFENAREYYKQVEKFLGAEAFKDAYMLDRLSDAQFKVKRVAEARKTMERSLAIRKENNVPGADNLLRIGQADLSLGNTKSARDYFAKARQAWRPYLVETTKATTSRVSHSSAIDTVCFRERKAASGATEGFVRQAIELKIDDPAQKLERVALLNDMVDFFLELQNSNDKLDWPLRRARAWIKELPPSMPGYSSEAARTYTLSARACKIFGSETEAKEYQRIAKSFGGGKTISLGSEL